MKYPGLLLEELCVQAQHEVLLVAPFIKVHSLERLLGGVAANVRVQCVTRWRPDEIAAGVSDLDVWFLVRERVNSSLWLRSDLHAKYYRGDQQVLVGSANLTNAALGWSKWSNLELLISSEILPDFERELFTGSVAVDDGLYNHVKQMVEALPANTFVNRESDNIAPDLPDVEDIQSVPIAAWLPMLRHPENLYIAYTGNWDLLGTGSRVAALHDLQALYIPHGLSREQFESYIGAQLLQTPIVRQVDQFIETPQRFGAVRDFLETLPCAAREDFDADIAWQTLMRWMQCFMPRRYTLDVPGHSEVFYRTIR